MGMMMLSPVLVALPFKLNTVFVLADGWNILLGSLAAASFHRQKSWTHKPHSQRGRNLYMLLMVAAPILATVLGVRVLLVSLFQAITQIHEATLSLCPS
jgi:hypothetical protein